MALEMAENPPGAHTDIFEGVDLLTTLIHTILEGPADSSAAHEMVRQP